MSKQKTCRPTSARGGFSVVEVMFAIVVLGIGFIMVAAIFPVGIQQGRAAVDDTTGRTIAQEAAYRDTAVLRMIAQDRDSTQYGAHFGVLQAMAPGAKYLWIDPTHTPAHELTIGTWATPPYGGGKINLDQMLNSDWKYMRNPDYVSQVLIRAYVDMGGARKVDLLALGCRDGRASADQWAALLPDSPYVQPCKVGFDTAYNDIYVQHATLNSAAIEDFLGLRGTLVACEGAADEIGEVVRLADETRSVKAVDPTDNPSGVTWRDAYMISKNVPVIGISKVTVSLP